MSVEVSPAQVAGTAASYVRSPRLACGEFQAILDEFRALRAELHAATIVGASEYEAESLKLREEWDTGDYSSDAPTSPRDRAAEHCKARTIEAARRGELFCRAIDLATKANSDLFGLVDVSRLRAIVLYNDIPIGHRAWWEQVFRWEFQYVELNFRTFAERVEFEELMAGGPDVGPSTNGGFDGTPTDPERPIEDPGPARFGKGAGVNLNFSGLPETAAAYAADPRKAIEDFASLLDGFHKVFRVYIDPKPPHGSGKWALILNMSRHQAGIALGRLRGDVEKFYRSVTLAKSKCLGLLDAIDTEALTSWNQWLFEVSTRYVDSPVRLKDADSTAAMHYESVKQWFEVEEHFRAACDSLGFELLYRERNSGFTAADIAAHESKRRTIDTADQPMEPERRLDGPGPASFAQGHNVLKDKQPSISVSASLATKFAKSPTVAAEEYIQLLRKCDEVFAWPDPMQPAGRRHFESSNTAAVDCLKLGFAIEDFCDAMHILAAQSPHDFSLVDRGLLQQFARHVKVFGSWEQLGGKLKGIDGWWMQYINLYGDISDNCRRFTAASEFLSQRPDHSVEAQFGSGTNPPPNSTRDGGDKKPKIRLNAIVLHLIEKHGTFECVKWSVRDWALNIEPQWGKPPSISRICKLPAYIKLQELLKENKQAMVEKQTARDEKGKRRSTRF